MIKPNELQPLLQSSIVNENTDTVSKPTSSLYQNIEWYFRIIWNDPQTKKLFIYTLSLMLFSLFQVIILGFLYSHSLVVLFSGLSSFQTSLSYSITIISTILSTKQLNLSGYSYGFERLEVIMRFSNGTFCLFICFAMFIESLHHFLEPHEIHLSHLWIISILGACLNFLGVYIFKIKAKGIPLSKQTYNREIFYDIIGNCLPHLGIIVALVLVNLFEHHYIDISISIFIAILLTYFSVPIVRSTGRVLLQTSPPSIKVALSKCLREANSCDGVLECRHEHFWAINTNLGLIVATLKVRVSKNANEQLVLSNLTKIFSPLFSHLTIQIEKDNWNFKTSSDAEYENKNVDLIPKSIPKQEEKQDQVITGTTE